MKGLLCNRWFRIGLCLTVSVAAVLVLLCWRYRVWSRNDFLDYMTVRHYAIGPDLWFGRITAGQDEKELIARHPPHRTRQVGPFTHLSYYSGGPLPPMSLPFESLCVIIKGGKVVGAGGAGCTWQRVFIPFSAEDQAEAEELTRQENEEFKRWWRTRQATLAATAVWCWAGPHPTPVSCAVLACASDHLPPP